MDAEKSDIVEGRNRTAEWREIFAGKSFTFIILCLSPPPSPSHENSIWMSNFHNFLVKTRSVNLRADSSSMIRFFPKGWRRCVCVRDDDAVEHRLNEPQSHILASSLSLYSARYCRLWKAARVLPMENANYFACEYENRRLLSLAFFPFQWAWVRTIEFNIFNHWSGVMNILICWKVNHFFIGVMSHSRYVCTACLQRSRLCTMFLSQRNINNNWIHSSCCLPL